MTIPEWKRVLKKNIKHKDKLCELLELSQEQKERVLKKSPFPLNIPLRLVQKMQKRDLNDPIFLQFVPLEEEKVSHPQFLQDPLKEGSFLKTDSLISKYTSRVLMIPSSACAMHCRYCFRRHFPYEKTLNFFNDELDWISKHPKIQEVILSGGDPLSLSDEKLEELVRSISKIDHVKKIRFHTRFPIGIPERITEEFLSLLNSLETQCVFIVHVNHPNEIDCDIKAALRKVLKTGTPVLTQSVLLKNVNDSAETLIELFEHLTNAGIIPYYMHALDPVQGASHFDVDDDECIKIMDKVREELPGYAIPTLVREIPNRKSKTPLHTLNNF